MSREPALLQAPSKVSTKYEAQVFPVSSIFFCCVADAFESRGFQRIRVSDADICDRRFQRLRNRCVVALRQHEGNMPFRIEHFADDVKGVRLRNAIVGVVCRSSISLLQRFLDSIDNSI